MKLKDLIKQLKEIAEKHGNDMEVTMADFLLVVRSVFDKKSPNGKPVVVVTDQYRCSN